MKRLLIRLDDITPDMDWGKFARIRAMFERYGVRPILGVVPDNRDKALSVDRAKEDFWPYVRALQADGWTIAQHGYQHRYATKRSGLLKLNKASEFAGLPYEAQYEKIKKGRDILQRQGFDVTMFMAPGHTYDRNTLKALRGLGFLYVTDGYADIPYYWKGLLFIPCRSARPKLSSGVDTLCIHCNELEESDYRELEDFLEAHADSLIGLSELLQQSWYARRTLRLCLQEEKNLLLRRIRARAAKSGRLQRYLQETYDADAARKRRKRLLGLPKLLLPKGGGK